MTKDEGIVTAMRAYSKDKPVVVFSASQELLHGAEELKTILGMDVRLECTIIGLPNSAEEWNESDWPELFEAARQLWMSGRLFDEQPKR